MEKSDIKNDIKKKEELLLRELTLIQNSTLDSLVTLKKQDESLNNIQNEINNLDCKLTISEKIIKSMKTAVSFMFYDISKNTANIENTNNTTINENNIISQHSIFINDDQNINNNIDNNDNINLISNCLDKIKNNIRNQNDILNSQNIKIENLSRNTNNMSNRINNLNDNIKKIS
jgi:hypothetical protein